MDHPSYLAKLAISTAGRRPRPARLPPRRPQSTPRPAECAKGLVDRRFTPFVEVQRRPGPVVLNFNHNTKDVLHLVWPRRAHAPDPGARKAAVLRSWGRCGCPLSCFSAVRSFPAEVDESVFGPSWFFGDNGRPLAQSAPPSPRRDLASGARTAEATEKAPHTLRWVVTSTPRRGPRSALAA